MEMKSLSVAADLYSSWMESYVNFQSVFIEAMRRMHEKTVEMEEKGGTKDFYNIWIETYSETFKEFLKSGHFSHDMGTSCRNT